MKTPNTPFSTRLSGSAKETELRIRNIFQWEKKRPPVIAIIAAVLVVVLCGGLVGFAPRDERISELVPGKIGVLAAEEVPGGVVYATGWLRTANLYWIPSGQKAELVRANIPDVDLSTLSLTCEDDILLLEYLQFDDPFEGNDLWITTRYRVEESMPPEYKDGRAILASMVIDK